MVRISIAFLFIPLVVFPLSSAYCGGLDSPKPIITYHKVNPAKYFVNVKGGKGAFWLVLGQAYNNQWCLFEIPEDNVSRGYTGGSWVANIKDLRYIFLRPINTKHCVVSGNFNGWYLDSSSGRDMNIVIFFKPQAYYCLGLLISVVSIVVYPVFNLYQFMRHVRRKKR